MECYKDVAIGVLRNADARYLVGARVVDGLFEFPGGERIGSESTSDAVTRILCETLAVEVTVDKLIRYLRLPEGDFKGFSPLRLWYYTAEIRSGELRPNPAHYLTVEWMPLDKLFTVDKVIPDSTLAAFRRDRFSHLYRFEVEDERKNPRCRRRRL